MAHADQAQLNELAAHLRTHREELLAQWRLALRQDPELTTPSMLPRSALDDHVPDILRNYERRLQADHSLRAMEVDIEQRRNAAEHAANRWERGYEIRETMREWGHLQLIVQREVDHFGSEHPEISPAVLAKAREQLAVVCMEGISESAARYLRLRQAEANDRFENLAQSLQALQALGKERSLVLQQAAHELRGSVGVISNAATALARADFAPTDRDYFQLMLQSGVQAVGALLTDLMELARVEAGKDPSNFAIFDAAACLRECCERLRPVAVSRNLFLKGEGPNVLEVQGDASKLQRIVQYLVIDALRTITQGGVVVSWKTTSESQWALCVQDGGPGSEPLPIATAAESTADPVSRTDAIGPWIAKRLCSLLDARLHVEEGGDRGRSVTITLPLRYPQHGAS